MAPKLSVTTARGAKRATTTSQVIGASRVKCRALHSLDFDFTANPTATTQEQRKETAPFVREFRPPRKAPGREGKQREVSRLCPIDSTRVTDYKFTKLWTDKLARGSPVIIRNMPGFLESQTWFHHPDTNRDGEFTTRAPAIEKHKEGKPSFAVFRDSIIASALHSQPRTTENSHSGMSQLFDSLGVKFRVRRNNVSADALDYPNSRIPMEKFVDWLDKTGRTTSHNLDSAVERLLKSAKESSLAWEPFDAPLAFIREVLQYNQELGPEGQAEAISQLSGLIELEDRLTEDFPYPKAVRDIGGLTYTATSCSIRFGIRPLRSDLRRSTDTTVVGQLAGYSRALLVPPKLPSLGGQPLECHPHVREVRRDGVVRLSSEPVKTLEKKIWTRDFEETIPERVDATLKPGDALLIPNGWWYGIRSINYYNQLHATVGWYLQTDHSPYKRWKERNLNTANV